MKYVYLGTCAICSMGKIIMTLEFNLKRWIRVIEGPPGGGSVCAKAQEVIQHSSREERWDCRGAVRIWRALQATLTSLNFVPKVMGNVGGWGWRGLETRSWLGCYCQFRNIDDINRSSGPGESERSRWSQEVFKRQRKVPRILLGIQINAVSTTKSEMRGLRREMITE